MGQKLATQEVQQLKNMQPVSLTTSVDGNGTGVAVASPGIIHVKIATVTDAKRNTTTIETPFPFRIVGANVIGCTVTTSKELELGIRNGSSVIVSNVGIGTDNLIKDTTAFTWAYSNTLFGAGDDDLVVTLSGTSIGVAVAVLHILHV